MGQPPSSRSISIKSCSMFYLLKSIMNLQCISIRASHYTFTADVWILCSIHDAILSLKVSFNQRLSDARHMLQCRKSPECNFQCSCFASRYGGLWLVLTKHIRHSSFLSFLTSTNNKIGIQSSTSARKLCLCRLFSFQDQDIHTRQSRRKQLGSVLSRSRRK